MGANHDRPVVHVTQTRKISSPIVHSPLVLLNLGHVGKNCEPSLHVCNHQYRNYGCKFFIIGWPKLGSLVPLFHGRVTVFKEQLKFPWKEIKCLVFIKLFCTLFKHILNRMLLMVHPLMRFLHVPFYAIYPKGMTLRKY